MVQSYNRLPSLFQLPAAVSPFHAEAIATVCCLLKDEYRRAASLKNLSQATSLALEAWNWVTDTEPVCKYALSSMEQF